jgi:hypothetical protein
MTLAKPFSNFEGALEALENSPTLCGIGGKDGIS